jgi:energy-coupling factor transporter ATP-binding protein EcfA2
MRLSKFKITHYRNILDSGWISTTNVTAFVGQNEAGKSNLFEALYCLNPYVEGATYDTAEDWPVDDWPGRQNAKGKRVCEAYFDLDKDDIQSLFGFAQIEEDDSEGEETEDVPETETMPLPDALSIFAYKEYGHKTGFSVEGAVDFGLDNDKIADWALKHLPKFVLIQDYNFSGTQVELDQLKVRWDKVGRENRYLLSPEDQTILIVLDLAQIKFDDFIEKGATADGRTIRQFDKRAASAYLTNQFQKLWSQKKVKFDIEIDGPTLNIFAEDEVIGYPVRLNRRSTGFRWYVSFAWKFTHASGGEFKNCILLLEEPGVHLHYSGQRDLLRVFDGLSETNTILYTTHLASMVDQANPERVRIVETRDNHVAINHGVVSSQAAPMAVIEASLGLTSDLSGMLGNRKVLIVEGGTDALILNKLSGILSNAGKTCLSDQIYLWPAATSTKAPMYAAFAIGQRWDAGVLLDSDEAGLEAKKKISEMNLKELAEKEGYEFRVLMLGEASGVKKTDVAIEDLFPDDFFRECVNRAYGIAIESDDLPVDGSTLISKRVEKVLKERHGKDLDKKQVLSEMLKKFDSWTKIADLPKGTGATAEKLFKKINGAFKLT